MAAQLRELLLNGDYAPGDKLPPERSMVDQFGVGRSSIREALRMLEAENLVRTVHGVGVLVVDSQSEPVNEEADQSGLRSLLLEGSTVLELLEARRGLEETSAGLAATRLTPQDEKVLREMAAQFEQVESAEDYVALDVEFHLAIARAAKNRILLRLTEDIRQGLVGFSSRGIQMRGRRERATAEHKAIMEAIVARRPGAAKAAMLKHLEESERDLLAVIDRHDGVGNPTQESA